MLSANFKPKRTAAASRGFLATAWLSCLLTQETLSTTKMHQVLIVQPGRSTCIKFELSVTFILSNKPLCVWALYRLLPSGLFLDTWHFDLKLHRLLHVPERTTLLPNLNFLQLFRATSHQGTDRLTECNTSRASYWRTSANIERRAVVLKLRQWIIPRREIAVSRSRILWPRLSWQALPSSDECKSRD